MTTLLIAAAWMVIGPPVAIVIGRGIRLRDTRAGA